MLPAAVLFALASAAAAPASTRPSLQLLVRDETTPPLDGATLRGILKEVCAIWHGYLDIESVPAPGAGSFITDDVLTLVITDQPSRDPAAESLGWIEFVDGQPSRTITISRRAARLLGDHAALSDRPVTEWPAAVRQLFIVRALGRAGAHEVGHYLLASKAHESSGLMRASFPTNELIGGSATGFRLNAAELRQLERRFSAYRLARLGLQEQPVQ